MGLKFRGPLISRFFPVVNITALYDPRLVESVDVELWI